jgi:hypothetical protein
VSFPLNFSPIPFLITRSVSQDRLGFCYEKFVAVRIVSVSRLPQKKKYAGNNLMHMNQFQRFSLIIKCETEGQTDPQSQALFLVSYRQSLLCKKVKVSRYKPDVAPGLPGG